MNSEDDHSLNVDDVTEGDELIVGQGRYKIGGALGEGFFGQVFRARDLSEGDEVAVKVFFKHAGDAVPVLIEARTLRRVAGLPRIVQLRNVETRGDDAPVIAMEYLPGGSVLGRLAATGQADLRLALRWLRDVLEALAGAHRRNVVHRDIKASNLLLDDNDHAVLADFGVSEDTLRGVAASRKLYRPLWAPEFIRHRVTTMRTDVWQVGVLGYYLLTGQYPFDSPEAALTGARESLHHLNAQVPIAVTRAIDRALQPDPDERYADAREMLEVIADQTVFETWVEDVEPGMVEAWHADTRHGSYRLTIRELRGGRFEIKATAAPGRRLRERRLETRPSEAQARQVARRWLLHVVGGKPL